MASLTNYILPFLTRSVSESRAELGRSLMKRMKTTDWTWADLLEPRKEECLCRAVTTASRPRKLMAVSNCYFGQPVLSCAFTKFSLYLTKLWRLSLTLTVNHTVFESAFVLGVTWSRTMLHPSWQLETTTSASQQTSCGSKPIFKFQSLWLLLGKNLLIFIETNLQLFGAWVTPRGTSRTSPGWTVLHTWKKGFCNRVVATHSSCPSQVLHATL